MTNYISNHTE